MNSKTNNNSVLCSVQYCSHFAKLYVFKLNRIYLVGKLCGPCRLQFSYTVNQRKYSTKLLLSWGNDWSKAVTEAAVQRCSWKKVLWKYAANLQESNHAEVRFATLFRYGCSPVNLRHIFRTPFQQNICKQLLLQSRVGAL